MASETEKREDSEPGYQRLARVCGFSPFNEFEVELREEIIQLSTDLECEPDRFWWKKSGGRWDQFNISPALVDGQHAGSHIPPREGY